MTSAYDEDKEKASEEYKLANSECFCKYYF